jgi:hypothetical protein
MRSKMIRLQSFRRPTGMLSDSFEADLLGQRD